MTPEGRAGGVYVISVAARLVEAHPRTLRIYEAEGLVRPARRNNLRLYSPADIRRLLLIRHLTSVEGVNLAGVRYLLALYDAGRYRLAEIFPALADALRSAGFPDESADSPTPPAVSAATTEEN